MACPFSRSTIPYQSMMHTKQWQTRLWRWAILLLVFFPQRAVAEDQQEIIIEGAGTRITTALYQKAAFAYRFVKNGVTVKYEPTNSGRSTCRLMSHADRCNPEDTTEPLHIEFAQSDSALREIDYSEYPDLQVLV